MSDLCGMSKITCGLSSRGFNCFESRVCCIRNMGRLVCEVHLGNKIFFF